MTMDARMSFPSEPDDEDWDDDLEADEEADDLPLDLFTSATVDTQTVAARRSLPIIRPRTRSQCADVPRPCPFVSCRHHLYLDVREDGSMRVNFPDREPDEMMASCTLDLATDGPRTLDIIGALMGVSKERARQLERTGLQKVRSKFRREDVE